MGIFDRAWTEVERSAGKIDKEVIRPYAREFERIPVLGDPMRQLHESRVEVRQAEKAARRLQEKQRIAQQSEMLRQSSASKLMAGERAKQRRMQMADALVGQEVGLFSTASIEGPNLAVNNIMQLDPLDEMGNSIPEVT